jgi:hypothetical protein
MGPGFESQPDHKKKSMRAFSDRAFSFCTSFSLSFSFFLQSEKQNENEEIGVRSKNLVSSLLLALKL